MIGRVALCILLSVSAAHSQSIHPAVHIVRAGNSAGSGSCIWSGNNRSVIVTCSHVVSDAPSRVSADGVKGWLIANDRKNDVALIEVQARFHVLPVYHGTLKRGDMVESIAFPGMRKAHRRGPVIGFFGKNVEANFVCLPGQSGGSVTFNGQVAGVSWGGKNGYRIAVITPSPFIRRLFEPFLRREMRYAQPLVVEAGPNDMVLVQSW